jgi:flagellar basal-body rod protein FlgG
MLIGALYASGTGLQAASNNLDVVSNNVANSNTVGYKTSQATFQDLLYNGLTGGSPTRGDTPPGGIQVGAGTALSGTTSSFTQGSLATSNGPLDLAISGQGFFAVNLGNGTVGYTRAGNFSVNTAGQIVTSDGYVLAGLTVPTGTTAVTVSASGAVTATTPTGTQQVGQLQLTEFQNPGGLERVGDTTFVATPASGATVTGDPGTGGLGTLTQGELEQSNVDLTSELVNLVIAQQAFQYNSEALNAENETLQGTTQLLIQ